MAENKDISVTPQYGKTTLPHHKWRLDNYGNIDEFAVDIGYHNGPVCIRCGELFCQHCHPECYDEPCTAEGFICPTCKDIVAGGDNFCSNCGQHLTWESNDGN